MSFKLMSTSLLTAAIVSLACTGVFAEKKTAKNKQVVAARQASAVARKKPVATVNRPQRRGLTTQRLPSARPGSFSGNPGGQNGPAPQAFVGSWSGKLTTEAIQVDLQVTLQGDSKGSWKFIGAGGVVLNQGKIQWGSSSGSDITMLLLPNDWPGNPVDSAPALRGILSNTGSGKKITGKYHSSNGAAIGGFLMNN